MIYDVAIIGAGMAGASVAAEVAGAASVLILETETAPGYHATGRSASFWHESYGGPGVLPLTTASGPWLGEKGFLSRRGDLTTVKHCALEADAVRLEACALRRSFDSPISHLSTPRAAFRPSAIAHTTSDWPRGISPAAKTPSIEDM